MRTFLLGLLLLPATTFANGATYGGSGSDVYPVMNSDVAMESEYVRLTIQQDDDRSFWTSSVAFDCTFRFVDHGATDVVHMGFPLVPLYHGVAVAPDSARLGFRAEIDGVPVPVRGAKDGEVLLWDVPFAGVRERTVRVRYTLPWSWSDLSLYPGSMTYVLETGALWRDPIGHGVVELVGGTNTPLVAFSFDPIPTSFDHGVARWEFRNARPSKNVVIRFSPEIAEGYAGRFAGPYELGRLPDARSAREFLELVDGEWEEFVLEGDSDLMEVDPAGHAAVDSARVARRALEESARSRVLTPIERINLAYARAVERTIGRTHSRMQLEAALHALHERFW